MVHCACPDSDEQLNKSWNICVFYTVMFDTVASLNQDSNWELLSNSIKIWQEMCIL